MMAQIWMATEIVNEKADQEAVVLELSDGSLTIKRGNPLKEDDQLSIQLDDIKRLMELCGED